MGTGWWVALALVVALSALVLVTVARRWAPRLLVSRETLKKDDLGGRFWLVLHVARLVYPVRLTGVGGEAQRLDLSVIEKQPDLDLCGVPVGDLAPLRNREVHAVFHPVWLEIWMRSGRLSYRQVAAFERSKLHRIQFSTHDPDGIGAADLPFRTSLGTLKLSVSERLHVFLLVRLKPEQALAGPGTTHPHGFS